MSIRDLASGVVSCGVGDNINTAITRVGKGVVLLESGNFSLADQIAMKTGVRLVGAGVGEIADPGTSTGVTVLYGIDDGYAIQADDVNYWGLSSLKLYEGGISVIGTSAQCRAWKIKDVTLTGIESGNALNVVGGASDRHHGQFHIEDTHIRDVDAGHGAFFRHCSDSRIPSLFSTGVANDCVQFQDSASFLIGMLRGDYGGGYGLRFVSCNFMSIASWAALDSDGNGLRIGTGSHHLTFGPGWVRDNGRDTGANDEDRAGIWLNTDVAYVSLGPVAIADTRGESATQTYPLYNLPASCSAWFTADGHSESDTAGGTVEGAVVS